MRSPLGPLIEYVSTLWSKTSTIQKITKSQFAALLCRELILPFVNRACKDQALYYAHYDGLDHKQMMQQLDEELGSLCERAYEKFSGEPLPGLKAKSERKAAQSSPEQSFLSGSKIERSLAEGQKILDRSARRRQEIDEALRKSKESRESSLEKTRAGIDSFSKRLQERLEAQWEESDKRTRELHDLHIEFLKQRMIPGSQATKAMPEPETRMGGEEQPVTAENISAPATTNDSEGQEAERMIKERPPSEATETESITVKEAARHRGRSEHQIYMDMKNEKYRRAGPGRVNLKSFLKFIMGETV